MKKISITSGVVAVVAVAILLSTGTQGGLLRAKPLAPNGYADVGVVIICIIVAVGTVSMVREDGTTEDRTVPAEGNAELLTVDNSEEDQAKADAENRALSTFQVQSIQLSGHDDTYGDYTFTSNGGNVQNSTIWANNPGDEIFPATADIYANATGTISGLPGTFTSQNPCHMRADNLTSFNPQVNAEYNFVDDVTFSNEDGTTFTLRAGASVTVN